MLEEPRRVAVVARRVTGLSGVTILIREHAARAAAAGWQTHLFGERVDDGLLRSAGVIPHTVRPGFFRQSTAERFATESAKRTATGFSLVSSPTLLPTLAMEAGHQWYVQKRWRWQWLWIAIVPAGFAVYLFLNWRISGDPFAFLKMRKQLFHMSFSWPWIGIKSAIGNMHRTPNQAEIVGGEEFFATILMLVCAIISWIKMRPSYATWITGNWIVAPSSAVFPRNWAAAPSGAIWSWR